MGADKPTRSTLQARHACLLASAPQRAVCRLSEPLATPWCARIAFASALGSGLRPDRSLPCGPPVQEGAHDQKAWLKDASNAVKRHGFFLRKAIVRQGRRRAVP